MANEMEDGIFPSKLPWAACAGNLKHVRKLIPNSRPASRKLALRWAVNQGHVDCVRELLAAGTNTRDELSSMLILAVWGGFVDCIRVLVDAGADVHWNDDDAIFTAARSKLRESIRAICSSTVYDVRTITKLFTILMEEGNYEAIGVVLSSVKIA